MEPIPVAARSVMSLRSLACWNCGFEFRRPHVMSVVLCCQVQVCGAGRSLVQRSPTVCGVSECDRGVSIMRGSCPTRGLLRHRKKQHNWCNDYAADWAMRDSNLSGSKRFFFSLNPPDQLWCLLSLRFMRKGRLFLRRGRGIGRRV